MHRIAEGSRGMRAGHPWGLRREPRSWHQVSVSFGLPGKIAQRGGDTPPLGLIQPLAILEPGHPSCTSNSRGWGDSCSNTNLPRASEKVRRGPQGRGWEDVECAHLCAEEVFLLKETGNPMSLCFASFTVSEPPSEAGSVALGKDLQEVERQGSHLASTSHVLHRALVLSILLCSGQLEEERRIPLG